MLIAQRSKEKICRQTWHSHRGRRNESDTAMTEKKTITIALAMCLLLTLLPVNTAAAGESYKGEVLMAYNPSTGSETVDGSFTCESALSGSGASLADASAEEPPFPACGTPALEDARPLWVRTSQGASLASAEGYQVGARKTIFDGYRNDYVNMECVAIGRYCTVWTSVSDPFVTRPPAETVQTIMERFDIGYPRMIHVFGNHLDADGDGKLAILCYDIGENYARQTDALVGGYGYYLNMMGEDGSLNTGTDMFTFRYTDMRPCFGMDCIHINTSGKDPYDFSETYHTDQMIEALFHEYQHIINASWMLLAAESKQDMVSMESLMNEGMSRAAEYLMCGETYAAALVERFNYRNFPSGKGVFNWSKLDNEQYYSAFLLLEYMRTRYAALYDSNDAGNGLFRKIQEIRLRNIQDSKDTLGLVANDLFLMDKAEFVKNMWVAFYCREDKGPRGFGGEEWSKKIDPYVYDTLPGSDSGITNGGVRFYAIPFGGLTVTSARNLSFEAFGEEQTPKGVCGPDAQWYLTTDGHLYIHGEGELNDYSADEPPPWHACRNMIREVTVEEGITSLGSCALINCSGIREIQLPSTLTSIGTYAFFSCRSLEKLTIPDSVTAIAWQGMGYCQSLESVSLSAGCTYIPGRLFQECASLGEIEIPDGVTRIGQYAFLNCGQLHKLTIPATVTAVEHDAFAGCTGLTDVYFEGTEAQWAAVTVEENNLPLTETATIHCLEASPEDPAGAEISRVEMTSDGSVNAYVVNPDQVGTLFCASYTNDGRMSSIQTAQADENDAGYFFYLGTEEYDYIRLFLLDDQSKPLCGEKQLEREA